MKSGSHFSQRRKKELSFTNTPYSRACSVVKVMEPRDIFLLLGANMAGKASQRWPGGGEIGDDFPPVFGLGGVLGGLGASWGPRTDLMDFWLIFNRFCRFLQDFWMIFQ